MWALRILTGPQSGQILELKMGKNLIGRSPQCDIKLLSAGVSKEHSELEVHKEKIIVKDLKSSNGTYLNGVKIQSSVIRLGDKLSIHDILADIVPASARLQNNQAPVVPQYNQPTVPTPQMMTGAMSSEPAPAPAPAYREGGLKGLIQQFQEYMDRVALPGVYKLPELIEFRMVLLGFILVFILATTLLSMIPMIQITRASIINEGKRRAASIARTLATLNQAALLQNNYSNLSTNSVESEEGVKQVLIIQQSDGMILAPASRAGTIPDLPFVHKARLEMRPQSAEIDSSTIGASFPIGLFDPNTGEQSVKAHAIVLYDIGSLAFDDGRAISLFMQTLLIACVLGLIVFYFMYKLIEYPLNSLNAQLDVALREKKDTTEVDFLFPPLQNLIGNVNSLLTRYVNGEGGDNSQQGFVNKDAEAENLVQVVGFPCVAINREGRIISCNPAFSNMTRVEIQQLQAQPLQALPDMALQQNIEHLLTKTRENSRVIHTDQLEFSGHLCLLSCQALSGATGEIDYFIVTVSPAEGGA